MVALGGHIYPLNVITTYDLMKVMRLLKPQLLRLLVLLLLTVFITETVYASGMVMAAVHTSSQNADQSFNGSESYADHCHDMQSNQQSDMQSHQKQPSHSNSTSCSHCIACFSIIPEELLSSISMTPQLIGSEFFVEIYLSPDATALQRPPISI